MNGCPFCRIIAGADPDAHVVFRDQHVTALFPDKPATRGHTLVIPNRHVASFTDVTRAESQQLGAAVRRVARAVQSAVSPEGMNIIQSTGEAATQSVPHVHFHVVPRWTGDRIELAWPSTAIEDPAAQLETLRSVKSLLPANAEDVSAEDRRQHLSFIQAVISRMSQASSSAKTWLMPIIALTYGYALTKEQPWVALLGVIAAGVFGVLDANYLKQEREFRKLYDTVANGGDIPTFSMNPTLAGTEGKKKNYWPDRKDFMSWAVAPVYLPLIAVGVLIALWAAHCT